MSKEGFIYSLPGIKEVDIKLSSMGRKYDSCNLKFNGDIRPFLITHRDENNKILLGLDLNKVFEHIIKMFSNVDLDTDSLDMLTDFCDHTTEFKMKLDELLIKGI